MFNILDCSQFEYSAKAKRDLLSKLKIIDTPERSSDLQFEKKNMNCSSPMALAVAAHAANATCVILSTYSNWPDIDKADQYLDALLVGDQSPSVMSVAWCDDGANKWVINYRKKRVYDPLRKDILWINFNDEITDVMLSELYSYMVLKTTLGYNVPSLVSADVLKTRSKTVLNNISVSVGLSLDATEAVRQIDKITDLYNAYDVVINASPSVIGTLVKQDSYCEDYELILPVYAPSDNAGTPAFHHFEFL